MQYRFFISFVQRYKVASESFHRGRIEFDLCYPSEEQINAQGILTESSAITISLGIFFIQRRPFLQQQFTGRHN